MNYIIFFIDVSTVDFVHRVAEAYEKSQHRIPNKTKYKMLVFVLLIWSMNYFVHVSFCECSRCIFFRQKCSLHAFEMPCCNTLLRQEFIFLTFFFHISCRFYIQLFDTHYFMLVIYITFYSFFKIYFVPIIIF